LTDSNRARCKTAVQEPLDDLLSRFLDAKGSNTPLSLDFLSGHTSKVIVDQVSQILGSKSSTHKKGKYLPNDVCRTQCLISTITKATDLIRTLVCDETGSHQEKEEVREHLRILFDRLAR